jgi:hypothetical protein
LEIARCPIALSCLENDTSGNLCQAIVQSQAIQTEDEFQVPEPWSGHIATAPILFLSSNPSIALASYPLHDQDDYPHGDWTNDAIVDFFDNRFAGGNQDMD